MGIAEEKPFHPHARDPEAVARSGDAEAKYESRPQRLTAVQVEIGRVCDEIKSFLIAKNDQYGNSAVEPVRIFSKASTEEQLRVRIDDKISRLVRGNDSLEADDDIVDDLIGYFVLWKVVSRRKNA